MDTTVVLEKHDVIWYLVDGSCLTFELPIDLPSLANRTAPLCPANTLPLLSVLLPLSVLAPALPQAGR